MNIRIFIFSLFLLTISCNNEIDINNEWEDITYIVCVLNQNNTVHYLRIQRGYLGEGDIRGIYRKTLNDIGSILDRLYLIQSSLYSFSLPRMSELWNLNQICAEFMLFGQHVARIFFKVTGKQA